MVIGFSADVLSNVVGCHLQDFQVCQNIQCATLECSYFIFLQEPKKEKPDKPYISKQVVQNDLKIC